jgi:ubiquinone/menaquinone biosynthesis C-methylase UbiE
MHDDDPLSTSLSDHAEQNRRSWNATADAYLDEHGAFLKVNGGLAWGVWQIPEAELQVLGDVRGKDMLELGCGAAQWSIALARAGARPVGLDLSERQLEHARTAMARAGLSFPLVHASAEHVPLPDVSFDVVFCDYGATTFTDPHRTIPEVARLLRPGGLFAFSHSSPILSITWAAEAERAGDRLIADYFGMRKFEYEDSIDFNLPYGEWIALFHKSGFEVEDLIETRPAADAVSTYRDELQREWSRRWPAECIWRARRR